MAKVKTIEYSGELRIGARLVIDGKRVDVLSPTEVKEVETGDTLKVVKPKEEAKKSED